MSLRVARWDPVSSSAAADAAPPVAGFRPKGDVDGTGSYPSATGYRCAEIRCAGAAAGRPWLRRGSRAGGPSAALPAAEVVERACVRTQI
ncbi:hypothetical protein ACP70R_013868 [Stipagrostis hirtigluma subsp. patula]